MSNKLKAYVAIIVLLGISFFLYTLNQVNNIDVMGLIIFVLLSIISESLIIVTSGQRALSVGFVISLAAILIFGSPEAAWICSIGIMLRVVKHNGKFYNIFNFPISKTLFNGANIMLSAGAAGFFYEALGGVPGNLNLNNIILPILTCMFTCIIINAAIMSYLMHLITGERFINNFCKNIVWVLKDYFAMAPLGILMALAYINYGIAGVLLFLGPLLFARYSFKMYIDMKDMCIGVDENILNKPGRLTVEEFDKIRQHPEIGVKIIKDIDFLKNISAIILSHHERYDGTGYPEGRKNNSIPVESRILSIADVFDALTSERPYRNAMTIDEALGIIENGRGTQFDCKLADVFINMIKNNKEMERVAD